MGVRREPRIRIPTRLRNALLVVPSIALPLLALPAPADAPADGWITSKVRLKLLAASGRDALDVRVDSVDGRVTLLGTVENEQRKANAAEITRRVAGVTSVRNLLVVAPEASRNHPAMRGFEAID